jgi:hypothetical protein
VVPPARQRQFRAFAGLPIQVGWGIWGCAAVKRFGLTLG